MHSWQVRVLPRFHHSIVAIEDVIDSKTRFCSWDFPENFVDMAHPQDYVALDNPLPPEFIYHQNGENSRLILRISWKIDDKYIPMSFVCDTSAPCYFYVSRRSFQVLEEGGRTKLNVFGNSCVKMQYGGLNNCTLVAEVRCTPENFQPANLIGLSLLSKLGLRVDKGRFSFERKVLWF
jgi:hypothetical protein